MTKLLQRHAGWFQLLFVVTVVGGAVLLSVSLKPEVSNGFAAAKSDRLTVSVVSPEPTMFEPTIQLNGVVESRTITQVIPQVGGRVVEVSEAFRAGAEFDEGEVLFRIESSDYELAVERTLAEIEAARSELARLEAEAAAEKQVWYQQYPERKIPDLIARVPQIAAANARIHSGEAARESAELSLARTEIRAPFAGRVLDTELDVGQVVGAGVAVGAIFSNQSLEIAVPVSSAELALIGKAVGRTATVVREGRAGATLEAEVVRQAAALDEQTRLSTLFLATEAKDELMLGEFVGVEIRGQAASQVYPVPAAALTSRDQVWVVDTGVLREREVEVIGNGNDIAFVRSFDIGDGVVAIPPSNGRDGLPVTIQTERRLAGGVATSVAAD